MFCTDAGISTKKSQLDIICHFVSLPKISGIIRRSVRVCVCVVCFLLLGVIFSYWGCKMVQEEACAAEVTRKHNEEMTELLSLYYTRTRNTVRDLKEQASSNKGCINKTCKHTPHCLAFPHIHTHSLFPRHHTHTHSHTLPLTLTHVQSLFLSVPQTHSIFSTYPG